MTALRNRTFWRRREMRLMREEQQRAISADMRQQHQALAQALAAAGGVWVERVAAEDLLVLRSLQTH